MAQGRRVERMASQIRREVSQMLMGGIKDERVSHGLVSVTSVVVAGDLQHCKIFVSVFGTADDQSQAMEGLASASSFVKGELGRRLKMRRTPELVFVLDRGFERSANVLGILHQLEQKRLEKGDLVTSAAGTDDEHVRGVKSFRQPIGRECVFGTINRMICSPDNCDGHIERRQQAH